MNSSLAQRQQIVVTQLEEARNKIAAAEAKLREIDNEIEGLSEQRQRYILLGQAYDALQQLGEIGAANLFWGDDTGNFDPARRMQEISTSVSDFRAEMERYEEARRSLFSEITDQDILIDELNYKLDDLNEALQRQRDEFVVEREIRVRPYQPAVMPWNREGEDQRRFRKVLLLTLLFLFLVGGIPMVWKLPPPEKAKVVVVPENLAKMIKERKKNPPKPPTPPKQEKPKEEEKPKETPKPTEVPKKPRTQEQEIARTKVQNVGVLAEMKNIAGLLDEAPTANLGANANARTAGSTAAGGSLGTRSMIVANAGSGSGGIANATRSIGGAGGGAGGAVVGGGGGFGKRSSAIAAIQSDDKPTGGGGGSSRSHEEIQIVFDKHKAMLYRLYNRELRNDPSLRGKLVLALTIEPDGSVSSCRIQSSDLKSPALEQEIVAKVLKFDFGAKPGIPPAKISYPIDFFPPS